MYIFKRQDTNVRTTRGASTQYQTIYLSKTDFKYVVIKTFFLITFNFYSI